MLRIEKRILTLGSRKPLVFSTNIAGGVKRLTGVGVFVPAIENQFASADITPSSSQSVVVNPVGGRIPLVARYELLGGTDIYLCAAAPGTQNKMLKRNGNKYTISDMDIPEGSGRVFYLKAVTSGTLIGQQEFTTYYSADVDLSFAGTKQKDLVQSDTEPTDKFGLVLKRSDTLTVVLSSNGATMEISRSLPIFSQFNGISVKMMINNRQDNPLAMVFQPKITMPFTPMATTTAEAQREMKKALYFNLFDQKRLIEMNYDVRNHNKIDFIVDVSEGNTINEDYIGEQCDLKVYLRYE